jgi:hypothetical protein
VTDSREELERQLVAADRETDDVRVRMDTIRQAVVNQVESGWSSPWKSPETVDAKVRAWLSGNGEFQALLARQRKLAELRRSLTSQLDGLGGHTRG